MADYDVVVVGAGIAGSVCANYLAREGKHVLLLEQNHQSGGNMSGFTRKGFTFDAGDQSFESLGIVFPILDDLGVYDSQDWIKARYRMVSDDFDFYIDDIATVEEALRTAFPDEPGFTELFREIREVSGFLDSIYSPRDFPLMHDFSVGRAASLVPWLGRLKRWSTFRYREKACSVIRDPRLRHWLTNIGYYRMPYLFFAGFWHLWSSDYWYPVGGMQALHDRLIAAYTGAGGEVRFRTTVKAIRKHGSGRNAGNTGGAGIAGSSSGETVVETESGEVITAGDVVYAGDYRELVNEVIGPEAFPRRRVTRLREARLTEGLVSVYLGLDMTDGELSHHLGGAHHPFVFPNYEVVFPDSSSPADVHRDMWVALNHFGPQSVSAPPDKSTLTLQTYSSYSWENHWRNGGDQFPRTEAYRELKEQVGHELIATAERLVPGLRERVEFMDVGTPLSLKRFTRNTEGSSGGWCYDDRVSPVFRFPNLNMIRTPLRNVYACGHYALWPGGVISAVQCGRIVANLVSGRSILAPLGRR
jgi:all-trans-retinol 13,14-reductase